MTDKAVLMCIRDQLNDAIERAKGWAKAETLTYETVGESAILTAQIKQMRSHISCTVHYPNNNTLTMTCWPALDELFMLKARIEQYIAAS